jgi:hypothetical protein
MFICWDLCEGLNLASLPINVARFGFWLLGNKGFTKRMKLKKRKVGDIFHQKENFNFE